MTGSKSSLRRCKSKGLRFIPSKRSKAASVGDLLAAGSRWRASEVSNIDHHGEQRCATLHLITARPWLSSVMRTPLALPPPLDRSSAMRRHFTQTQSLEERLAEEAKRLHEQAELLPHGNLREAVERKARQAETGSHISEWLRSPGLRVPT